MKEQEKQKILARLAASDVASLKALEIETSSSADKIAVMLRIIDTLNVPIMQAKFVYQNMINQLQKSDLTINFMAYKFFNTMPKGHGYVNQFEGGNKWGSDSYINTRDEAEEKLFDYSNTNGRVGVTKVIDRIKHFGSRSGGTNISFSPGVRPKYAALNYASLKYGSAGQWGLSYVVLKEHIKHNSTFVHTDSFDIMSNNQAGDMVANYVNMQRLLINMPETMLKGLYHVTKGGSFNADLQIPGLGSTAYVETHVHSGIQFDRDIQKICISNTELIEAPIKLQELKNNGKKFRVISSQKLKDIFTKFSQKFGITIEYI